MEADVGSASKSINASSTAMPEPAESQMNSSIKESQRALERAANAIESRDKARFIGLLSNETLSRVKGDPDLSTSDALKLARGLKEAKFIEMVGDIIIYEMVVGNATYSLTTTEEDGLWKITGL